MATRDEIHRLASEIPESEIHAALRFLEYLRYAGDPVMRAFEEAPEDDEPETAEEKAAVARGYEDIEAGRVVPSEQVWKELA